MFPARLSDLDSLRSNPMIKFKEEIVGGRSVTIVSYMIADKELWDNPLARECRGITYDTETGRCLCAPFEKFFNVGEREECQENVLPWDDIKFIYEKRDGSMLTPVLIGDEIFWKTKKSFFSDVAKSAAACVPDWIVKESRFFLMCGITPIYEFTHPAHQIVLNYGAEPTFSLLALRSVKTGGYFDTFAIGVADYRKTLPELKDDMKTLENFEGYVITFQNGYKVKMKTEWYYRMHHIMTDIRERDVADLVVEEKLDDIKSLAVENGVSIEKLEAIEHRVASEIASIASSISAGVSMLEGKTDKEAAASFRDHPYFCQIMRARRGIESNLTDVWKRDFRNSYSLDTLFSSFSTAGAS